MNITIIEPDTVLPTQFAHSLSMVIRSFKGRRDVEVHLFRETWDTTLEARENWAALAAAPASPGDSQDSSRNIVMESFTTEERDRIVNYLKEQYATRLTAITSTPLTFPVPAGLPALSQLTPGKDAGFIEFRRIPSYSLDIPLKGLYDLSQHPPLAND